MTRFIGASPTGLAYLEAELDRAERSIQTEWAWLQREVISDPEVADIVRVLQRTQRDISAVKSEARRVRSGLHLLGLFGVPIRRFKVPTWAAAARKGARYDARRYWRAQWAIRRGTATAGQRALVRRMNGNLAAALSRRRARYQLVRGKAYTKAVLKAGRGQLTRDPAKARAALKRMHATFDRLDERKLPARGGTTAGRVASSRYLIRRKVGKVVGRAVGRTPLPAALRRATAIGRSAAARAGSAAGRVTASPRRVVSRAASGFAGRTAGRVRSSRVSPVIARAAKRAAPHAARAASTARAAGRVAGKVVRPIAVVTEGVGMARDIKKGHYKKAAYKGARLAGTAMLVNPVTAPAGAALIVGSYAVEHRKKIAKGVSSAGKYASSKAKSARSYASSKAKGAASSAKKKAKSAKKKISKFFGR